MMGPMWLATLAYFGTTLFEPETALVEPWFSAYRLAVDATFWISLAQAICPILMTIDVAISSDAWLVVSLIMNWLWVIATGVLMYLYVGQFRFWHDLMSKKVADRF